MRTTWLIGALVTSLLGTAIAQDDPFPREGKAAQRAKKDPLEGKAPPALAVTDWRNTGDKALAWSDLRGKVVLIDFWGTW